MKKNASINNKFKTIDKLAILAALLFSSINIYYFFSYQPDFEVRTAVSIAKISFKKNDVKRKLSGSLTWSLPTKDETLFRGDEIFTGEDSLAIILLSKENIQLTLSPNSLVKVEYSEKKPLIEIKKGEAEILNTKNIDLDLKTNGQTFNIKASEQSNFKISSNSKSVGIRTISGDITVNKNKLAGKAITTFDNKEKLFKIDPIPLIKTPKEGQVIFQEAQSIFPQIVKNPSNKNDQIEFEIASDSYFEKIINIQNLESNVPLNNLSVGKYFIRIKSKDRLNDKISFEIKNDVRFNSLTPEDRSLIKLQRSKPIRLSWEANEGISSKVSIFNLSTNESTTYSTTNSYLSFIPKKDGRYSWKLEGVYKGITPIPTVEKQFNVTFLPIQQFSEPKTNKMPIDKVKNILFEWQGWPEEIFQYSIINKKTNKEIIKGKTPNNRLTWSNFIPGDYAFVLSPTIYVSELEKSKSYPFIIQAPLVTWGKSQSVELMDKNQSFEIPILELVPNLNIFYDLTKHDSVTNTQQTLTKNSKIQLSKDGKYCVKAYLKTINDYYFSPVPYCFTYKYIDPFPEILKMEDQVLLVKKGSLDNNYSIKYPRIKRAKIYQIIVSKDPEGKFIVLDKKSSSNEVIWETNRSGVYYLRYKAFDDVGRASQMSPASKLIFPISPLDELQ